MEIGTDGRKRWRIISSRFRNITCFLVVKRASRRNALYTNWNHTTKTNARGNLERMKALFVAYGKEQVLGIDHTLIFHAVMNLSRVKVIMAPAAT